MKVRVTVELTYTKAVRRLPPDRAKAANAALVKFLEAPSLPSLKFRTLKGKDNYFIISSAHGDRVILRKDADDLFAAVDVGPHDNVYRRWRR
jgi:mRNA-degrading endonuclease RelE of RelBE toxin-antitoxin system